MLAHGGVSVLNINRCGSHPGTAPDMRKWPVLENVMESDYYLVYLTDTDQPDPFKCFMVLEDADRFALDSVREGNTGCAEIRLVRGVSGPHAAVAAVQMGEGEFRLQRSRHPSPEEVKRRNDAAWQRAQEDGTDAMLKYLGLD